VAAAGGCRQLRRLLEPTLAGSDIRATIHALRCALFYFALARSKTRTLRPLLQPPEAALRRRRTCLWCPAAPLCPCARPPPS
jgi:hypothetical protein